MIKEKREDRIVANRFNILILVDIIKPSITLEKSLFLINDYHILFAHHFLISQIPCTTKIYGRDYMKTHANIIFLFYFNFILSKENLLN